MLEASLIRKLGSIVGHEHVLSDDGSRAAYSYDATRYRGEPDVIVRPRDTAETAKIVTLAYENSIPLTPRGAGTGLSGGSVPASGGIVLSAERMNGAPRIHKEDLYAEVFPGVVTENFQRAAESKGLFYPPDPASQGACTLGGNIAECAGGFRRLKYGTTRHYVLGLEIVTPQGEVLFTGARTVKSVAGYDITRLMVGSEGTLGFITSAVLRLLPMPQVRKALSASLADLETASEAVSRLIGEGLRPSTLEVMDETCVRAASDYTGDDIGSGVLLLAEFDGMPSVCDDNIGRAESILKTGFRAQVRAGLGDESRDRLWRARRAVLPALTRLMPTTLLEDVTVPRSKLSAMVEEIGKITAKYSVRAAVFGHAGDGSLHPTFLTDCKDKEEMARVKSAVAEIMQVCVDLDGTVSGEYGIGLDRSPYLKLDIGQSGYEVIKSLKGSLDPKGIMNPGKMFYED